MKKFSFKVWYYTEEDRKGYGYFRGMPTKFKYVKAFNKEDAISIFKKKYPNLFMSFVEV